MGTMCPRLPRVTQVWLPDARGGVPYWYANAAWGIHLFTGTGASKRKAQVQALRGVIVWRLGVRWRQRWDAEGRVCWPRWYDWLVGW